ncbi:MAG: MaoC family dehydratase [Candidatus Thorarchaeota archaeon]|jgi:acyl dehydratase
MADIRKKTLEGLQVGDTFSISRTFIEQDVMGFADMAWDYNPVHFDERFATMRFRSCICHGLLVGSLLTAIDGQIGWLASGMQFQFKKPVYVGETITCEFTMTHIDDRGRAKAQALFRNQDDITVLEAELTGILPGGEEKQVMHAMMMEGDPTNKLG